MTAIILRRRKLGRTSCRELSRFMTHPSAVVRNDQPIPPPQAGNNLLVRWGTTSNVPEGYQILNKAEAIHRVNDKLGFRRLLQQHHEEGGPKLCPRTWFDIPSFESALDLDDDENPAHYPVIVRPSRHAQGRNLYLCNNHVDVGAAVRRCTTGYYISEYIPKVAEYRVFVVQGRAVAVAKKTPGNPEDIAWNVARGGRFDNVGWGDWPLKAVKNAIIAFNLSGLDFGGVDVMVDAQGECYILEINSAPSLTSPYRQECLAKAIDWIAEHGRATIPVSNERGGWRKFIHPAISDEAWL